MSEIKPTVKNLSDPYVLQLIIALSKRDDEIETLLTDGREAYIEGFIDARRTDEGGFSIYDNLEEALTDFDSVQDRQSSDNE